MALTKLQKRFIDDYLIDLNATRAYRDTYKSCKKDETARVNSSKLLANPVVCAYLDKRMTDRQKRTEITQDRVLEEYAKLAFLDPRNLFRENGEPKLITELDDNTAAAIAGLDVQEVYEGFGEDREFLGYIKKYKLSDKKGALDSLARHLGMFKDKLEVSGSVEVNNPYQDLTSEELRKLINSE